MTSPRLLIALIPALLLLVPLPAGALTVPALSTLLRPNGTVDNIRQRCNSSPDWIGDGVSVTDCKKALEELLMNDVLPRRRQEYEFYTRGAPRVDFPLPLVVTPRTHEYRGSRDRNSDGAKVVLKVAYFRHMCRQHCHAR